MRFTLNRKWKPPKTNFFSLFMVFLHLILFYGCFKECFAYWISMCKQIFIASDKCELGNCEKPWGKKAKINSRKWMRCDGKTYLIYVTSHLLFKLILKLKCDLHLKCSFSEAIIVERNGKNIMKRKQLREKNFLIAKILWFCYCLIACFPFLQSFAFVV